MRNAHSFAVLLMGLHRERTFTHVREHGLMSSQFHDELESRIDSIFTNVIRARDDEIIDRCKDRIINSHGSFFIGEEGWGLPEALAAIDSVSREFKKEN